MELVGFLNLVCVLRISRNDRALGEIIKHEAPTPSKSHPNLRIQISSSSPNGDSKLLRAPSEQTSHGPVTWVNVSRSYLYKFCTVAWTCLYVRSCASVLYGSLYNFCVIFRSATLSNSNFARRVKSTIPECFETYLISNTSGTQVWNLPVPRKYPAATKFRRDTS